MKIVLFGGHGRTGRCVTELSGGHEVVIFEGDVLQADAVSDAVRGVDAVISVIGHVKNSPAQVQSMGIRNMIDAMQLHGVARIVSLTGTGVRSPGDKISVLDWLMNTAIRYIDPARITDGIEHAKILQKGQLDYTVIRVLKLTNGPASDKWMLSAHGPSKTFISRKDVASAIMEVLEQGTFVKDMPIITCRT